MVRFFKVPRKPTSYRNYKRYYNRSRTEQARRKISQALLGHDVPEEVREKIRKALEKKGELLAELLVDYPEHRTFLLSNAEEILNWDDVKSEKQLIDAYFIENGKVIVK